MGKSSTQKTHPVFYDFKEMDRHRHPITKKEYENGFGGHNISHMLIEHIGLDNMAWVVGGSNPKEITEIFGKHDFTFKGSEHNCKMWSFRVLGSVNFVIAAANGRGVSIESDINPQNCTESEKGVSMMFAGKLILNILNLNNERIQELKNIEGLNIGV